MRRSVYAYGILTGVFSNMDSIIDVSPDTIAYVHAELASQRENVCVVVMMLVLAHHVAFVALCLGSKVWAERGDIDEKSRISVDPASINHVGLVGNAAIHPVRVDFEHIIATTRDIRQFIMMNRHVVIFGEMLHGLFRHLDINIGVPRHGFPIPEPSEQTAMHDPSFGSDIIHCR